MLPISQPNPRHDRPSILGTTPGALSVARYRPAAGTVVLVLVGAADLATAPDLRRALHEAADDCPDVVVDLDGLAFFDASTLGVLVAAHRRVTAAGGALTIRCHSRHGLRLLTVGGLDRLLEPSAEDSTPPPRWPGRPWRRITRPG